MCKCELCVNLGFVDCLRVAKVDVTYSVLDPKWTPICSFSDAENLHFKNGWEISTSFVNHEESDYIHDSELLIISH